MKILFTILLLLIPVSAIPQQKAPEPTLTKAEHDKAVKLLLDSQKETLDAVSKLSDAQWNYKVSPEKWSAGQVAEHIYLAESLLFASVEKAMASPENEAWYEETKGKDEFLQKILLDRSGKAQAPEAIKPTGKTRAEIIKGLKESRAKTLKFLNDNKVPMKNHTLVHPFKIFGTLNAYQWLIYIPLHNMRHNQQIMEVKNSPGFPKA